MRILVIGAAGGVGRRLSAQATAAGHHVTGVFRREDQAEAVAETGAAPLQADLIADDVDALAAIIAGHDAVVFTAGAHGTGMDQTTLIDGEGLHKTAAAAARAGVARLLLVSVFPDAGRDREPAEGFEHYMRVKREAEQHLTRTELDWVIVRPGTLTDEPGDGAVTAGLSLEYGVVSRDNVAAFLLAAAQTPALSRTIVELTDGTEPAMAAATRVADSTGPRE